jgi:hypothetical protein
MRRFALLSSAPPWTHCFGYWGKIILRGAQGLIRIDFGSILRFARAYGGEKIATVVASLSSRVSSSAAWGRATASPLRSHGHQQRIAKLEPGDRDADSSLHGRPEGTGKALVTATRGWEAGLYVALAAAAALAAAPRTDPWGECAALLVPCLAVLGLTWLCRRRLSRSVHYFA